MSTRLVVNKMSSSLFAHKIQNDKKAIIPAVFSVALIPVLETVTTTPFMHQIKTFTH